MADADYHRRFAARWVWSWPAFALLLLALQAIDLFPGRGGWAGGIPPVALLGAATGGWAAVRAKSWWCAGAAAASVTVAVLAVACYGWPYSMR